MIRHRRLLEHRERRLASLRIGLDLQAAGRQPVVVFREPVSFDIRLNFHKFFSCLNWGSSCDDENSVIDSDVSLRRLSSGKAGMGGLIDHRCANFWLIAGVVD
jgi:hypothetical protein